MAGEMPGVLRSSDPKAFVPRADFHLLNFLFGLCKKQLTPKCGRVINRPPKNGRDVVRGVGGEISGRKFGS
jgi:hypothetical protein